MKKNSLVWNFFDRIEDKGRCVNVICQLCEVEYRFFGNTTNLRVHLSRKHPIQWELANNNKLKLQNSSRGGAIVYQIIEDEDIKNPINILDDEVGATAAAFIQNDEEWLEDLYENVDYAPEQKKIKIKRRIKREVEESDNERFTSLHLKSPLKHETCNDSIVSQKSTPSDEYSAFGDYIANKLRNLKSPHTKGNIQQIITTVMWQAEYGSYDNVDSVRALLLSLTTNFTPTTTTDHAETLNTEAVFPDH